jgi:hypothetical protein
MLLRAALGRLLKKPSHSREPQAEAPTLHGLSTTWMWPRRADLSLLGFFSNLLEGEPCYASRNTMTKYTGGR